jgi:hypothetical protein
MATPAEVLSEYEEAESLERAEQALNELERMELPD